jgi:hypothetical protein
MKFLEGIEATPKTSIDPCRQHNILVAGGVVWHF